MRLAVVTLISVCALAQGLRVAVPKEIIEKPRFKAEPQYKLNDTPVNIYRDITAGDVTLRARALRDLYGNIEREYTMSSPPDITLRSVNLDDDSESENILILHMPFG